ncbi:MAG: HsmA family protein [Patescibacteria group bacterium]
MLLASAVVFIALAFPLYTIAIWSERILKSLKPWMVRIFISAFSLDVAGTSIMGYRTGFSFQFNIHSCCGYTALIIMGLHLAWALIALKRQGEAARYFHRFSIFAWFIWLAAFISGIPQA